MFYVAVAQDLFTLVKFAQAPNWFVCFLEVTSPEGAGVSCSEQQEPDQKESLCRG